MASQHLSDISDQQLIDAVQRAASIERNATAELLRLLGEFDDRQLYLGEGCASLYSYCTQVLRLSEHAAYHRIEGARIARQFPRILELLSSGALTLTTVVLLRPVLTIENADAVLLSAAFKSKREVEVIVARLAPKPDVQAMVRRIPSVEAHRLRFGMACVGAAPGDGPIEDTAPAMPNSPVAPLPDVAQPRAYCAPLAPDRFLLRLTISADTHAKLCRAQDLLRPSIPSGDRAAVLERALTMLVDHLERTRTGRLKRPRPANAQPTTKSANARHIPRAVRRAVWQRDEGRCTFTGPHGRCSETAWLECHHMVAFARGGPTDVANLTLRCRAHNQFDAVREFGLRPRPAVEKSGALPL